MANERHVVVFWDESVIPAARCSGFDAARFVCRAAGMVGAPRAVKYYVDVKGESKGASQSLRSELKTAGVTVIDTASSGHQASAAKMLITDALVYAIDNPAPRTLLLISADPDVCYAISLLRMRGYHVYLLCPPDSGPDLEEFQLPVNFDASDFLEAATQRPPSADGDSSGRARSRSRSTTRSRDPSNPSRRTPVQGKTNGLQNHAVDAPPLLPSSEIDAFRQRFTSSRPNLEPAGTNPFKPHRHSFSSFGRNGPSEPQVPDSIPSLRDLGRHLNVDLKGKGRAVDADSTVDMDSPIILTATSMSVSRSDSFGSIYRAPPSTAPTSAMPWYRSQFEMSGDGKSDGLKENVVLGGAVGSVVQSGAVGGGSVEAEVEEVGPIRIARSVSGTTDGSVTPTASPNIKRFATTAGLSSAANEGMPIVPKRELPQRIHVHASPPAAIVPVGSAHPPVAANVPTGGSSAWSSGRSPPDRATASTTPDSSTLLRYPHAAAPSAAKPPSSGGTSAAGIPLATTAAAQSATQTSSATLPTMRAERRTSTARAAGARDEFTTPTLHVGQSEEGSPVLASISTESGGPARSKTPLIAATISQPVASSSSGSSPASSLGSIIERFPGVPPHFSVLIEILREHIQAGRDSVGRGGLYSQLFARQPRVLAAAGTARFSKPFARYLRAAFETGIITSAEGNVALAEQYRQSIQFVLF